MDKKEYVLKLLDSLSDVRSLAKWLKIIVERMELSTAVIDMLMDAIKWAVHSAKWDISTNKLQKWLDFLQKMKEMELRQNEQDKKDIEQMEELLKQI